MEESQHERVTPKERPPDRSTAPSRRAREALAPGAYQGLSHFLCTPQSYLGYPPAQTTALTASRTCSLGI